MDKLSDYDYHLPEELIAQSPLEDRAASRLLHLHRSTGTVAHRAFRDVVDLLEAGDLLVMNDTRVSAMRVFGQRPSGGKVELLLLRDVQPGVFEAMAKPAKKLGMGRIVEIEGGLVGEVVGIGDEGLRTVSFLGTPDWLEKLQAVGSTPLPHYIHEKLADAERYQTVYATHAGSSAAPTAGLHFTREILDALRAKGVQTATVTLDVGIDTFRPVMVEDLSEHRMHGETCRLSEKTADAIAQAKGRIIAVGTTSVRTLETFAVAPRRVEPGESRSELFIRPGFDWKVVEGMFTNFHLPKTTMLMMISALAGHQAIFRAYGEAVQQRYRFLSFGDSMLIL